jgi:1-acyl-sn-glycerol-3-phosphate acyltransferase
VMKKINPFRRLTMSLAELEVYYRMQRKHRFDQGKPLKHIRLRRAFHPLFVRLLALDRRFRRQTITILSEKPKYTGQVIYACTHIAENDLENIYEVLGKACWWFIGDPCILYKNFSGLLLYINGQIFMEIADKTDRHIAYLRAVELLKKGGSLMIFPEGARNPSENLPVMPLFRGSAKMARETGVPIVPVAIEQYEKRFVIQFGQALFPQQYCSDAEMTGDLRDALATLKWNIWQSEQTQSRRSFPADYRLQFQKEFETRIAPWDTPESVERARFHTRAEMEHADVLDDFRRIIPKTENAFLFQNRSPTK